MLAIPLQPGNNQSVSVLLGGQQCRINVYEKSTGVYLDLYVNGMVVAVSVLCLNNVPMMSDQYLGFVGTLMFYDTQGTADPVASGFGSRYQLQYLVP